jgi:hypothetical protein
MKKLRLNTDEIRVVGFDVLPSDGERRGTVLGRDYAATTLCPTNGDDPTCRLGSCNTGNPCSMCP